MIVLVPIAGEGKRFKDEGYVLPKPLIDVDGKPMVLRAVDDMPKGDQYIFVCKQEHVEKFHIDTVIEQQLPRSQFIVLDHPTAGQAATCLLAKDLINNDQPLLIGAPDNGMIWDRTKFDRLISDPYVDAVIWTFRNNPSVKHNPQAYGWVKVDDQNTVEHVSCKAPISNDPVHDHAIIGTFWWRRGSNFVLAAEQMINKDIRVNNEFYADSVFNELSSLGLKAKVFEIDTYLGWGTPDDLKSYQYWKQFYKITANKW